MKTMLLAAGKGTLSVTDTTPKPLLPVGGSH